MAIPNNLKPADRLYTAYFADIATASDAYVPIAGVGYIKSINITPHVTLTGAATVVTPYVNTTQMQINGSNTTLSLAASTAAGSVNTITLTNGQQRVVDGDVIKLSTDGGATNGSAVPATIIIVVSDIGG